MHSWRPVSKRWLSFLFTFTDLHYCLYMRFITLDRNANFPISVIALINTADWYVCADRRRTLVQRWRQTWRRVSSRHQPLELNKDLRFSLTLKTCRLMLCNQVLCQMMYRVGQNKRGHSTFSQISRKLLKISEWFFAHIKASVCLTCYIHTNFSNSFYTVAPSGECWTIITNT